MMTVVGWLNPGRRLIYTLVQKIVVEGFGG